MEFNESHYLGDIARQTITGRLQVATQGSQRSRQNAGWVAFGDPNSDLSDINPKPDARPPRALRTRSAGPAHGCATSLSTVASRDGASSAGRPPPWARSALPPPRPDSAPFTNTCASSPRSFAAGFTATTSEALPPARETTATTPGRPASLPRTSWARVRTSLPDVPSGTSTATTATPPTSRAVSAR